MNNDEYYVVKFDNGKYYSNSFVGFGEEVDEIEKASTYVFDWQIPKDMYFQAYINDKNISYSVVKVKVTKIYEIIEEEL